MGRKFRKDTGSKKYRGDENFIPLAAIAEDEDGDAREFEAMGLPSMVKADEFSDDDMMSPDFGRPYAPDVDEDTTEDAIEWGKKLGNYYDEGSDDYYDDDDMIDRIEEAERIGQDIYDDVEDVDAEVEGVDEKLSEEDAAAEATALDSLLFNLGTSLRKENTKVELPHEFSQLSDSDKMTYLETEHPEFIRLLMEFKDKNMIVKEQVLKIVNDKESFKMCTKDGMEYLETRNELMLMYVSYLCFYLLLKVHGVPVANHNVINRLLEIRIMLDKAKPIESRLQFEINKLVEDKETKESEKKVLRPRLHLMEADEREQDGLYKPHAQLPIVETDAFAKHQKKIKRKEERVVSGRKMLDEMADEDDGSDTGGDRLGRSKAGKMMKALIEREKYEMENMKRLPMSKLAKKELREFNKKQLKKQGGGFMLDDLSGFASEVLDVGGSGKRDNILTGLNAAAQTMRQDILEAERLRAADASFKPLSMRKPLKGSSGSRTMGGGGSSSAPARPAPKKSEFDDEFSKMKKRQTELKEELTQKKEEGTMRKFNRTIVDGKRVASADIIRNKGLTRMRKKTSGNARVTNRMKFEKKQTAFKSKTSGVRSETPGGYSGESTGIHSKKKKSVTM